MYIYGKESKEKLETVHTDLREVLYRAINFMDIKILEGGRTLERQKQLFAEGATKTLASKHLITPENPVSRAVDIAPYPIDWENRERFHYMAGIIRGIAIGMGLDIRWGGDWDNDGEILDNDFDDLVHFELR